MKNNIRYSVLLMFMIGLCAISCSESTSPSMDSCSPSMMNLPGGISVIPFSAHQSYSQPVFLLGRALFYEGNLSGDASVSCASCHNQAFGFSDAGNIVSKGVAGESGMRNAPTLINSAFQASFFMDGRSATLERQIEDALRSPNEMYATDSIVKKAVMNSSRLSQLWKQAFGEQEITLGGVSMAIGVFTRMIVSGSTPHDAFLAGNQSALNQREQRGKLLFDGKAHCVKCHGGPHLSDGLFHSTGLHTHYYDKGRYYVTKSDADIGTFKTPTLRNIALTHPYMHDGSLPTLRSVIEHYNVGGKQFINKSSDVIPLNLTKEEMDDLEAYLHAFTDSSLIRNACLSKP
ncbi:MAG: cytochrome-c peroxidase [Ignavibacteria bacterium]|jgi:cytochrome c peroxidase